MLFFSRKFVYNSMKFINQQKLKIKKTLYSSTLPSNHINCLISFWKRADTLTLLVRYKPNIPKTIVKKLDFKWRNPHPNWSIRFRATMSQTDTQSHRRQIYNTPFLASGVKKDRIVNVVEVVQWKDPLKEPFVRASNILWVELG